MMIKRRDLLLSGGAMFGGLSIGLVGPMRSAGAHEYDVGKLKVEHPWLRAPLDGETKAYFYGFFHNNGDTPDKLIAVKSEKFGKVEIHGDARNLAAVTPVVLPPKSKTTLGPDGVHVVLLDIKKHLEVGWGLEMTLVFEKAGEVVIDAAIDAPDAKHAHDAEAMERWEKSHKIEGAAAPPPAGGHEHHHHEHKHEEPKK